MMLTGLVWERLDSPVLDSLAREYLFMIVNNIVPTRERLFLKMHMVNSPNCVLCNVKEDTTHMCAECSMVREAWGWTRQRILSLLPDNCACTSNFEILNLMFEKHVMDREVLWLWGCFGIYLGRESDQEETCEVGAFNWTCQVKVQS